jgi:phosphate starvation-inducible protein PhoH
MNRRKPTKQTQEDTSIPKTISRKDFINSIIKKKQKSKFLSDNQKEYYDILVNNQITICSGPAGVGKSYISMKAAVDLLMDPNNFYEKIIIVICFIFI